eukprot:scaffold184829_cov30-Tisochrysis_lutea.AAC.5
MVDLSGRFYARCIAYDNAWQRTCTQACSSQTRRPCASHKTAAYTCLREGLMLFSTSLYYEDSAMAIMHLSPPRSSTIASNEEKRSQNQSSDGKPPRSALSVTVVAWKSMPETCSYWRSVRTLPTPQMGADSSGATAAAARAAAFPASMAAVTNSSSLSSEPRAADAFLAASRAIAARSSTCSASSSIGAFPHEAAGADTSSSRVPVGGSPVRRWRTRS